MGLLLVIMMGLDVKKVCEGVGEVVKVVLVVDMLVFVLVVVGVVFLIVLDCEKGVKIFVLLLYMDWFEFFVMWYR